MPEEIDFEKELLLLEGFAEKQGWDCAPSLIMLVRTSDGEIEPHLLTDDFNQDNKSPDELLGYIAMKAVSKNDFHTISTAPDRETLGFMFFCEGWGIPEGAISEEEVEHLLATGRFPADHPAGVEVRSLIFVDLHGRAHRVARTRGKQPQYSSETDLLIDSITISLSCMSYAVARGLRGRAQAMADFASLVPELAPAD